MRTASQPGTLSWVREVRAEGLEAVLLASALLQRMRLGDPVAGLWEPADMQWWWRRRRASDAVPQVFWTDGDGPVAAALLTSWPRGHWQADALVAPGAGVALDEVWAAAWDQATTYAAGALEVLVRDDDAALGALVEASGLTPDEGGAQTWMDAADRPEVRPLPEGYRLVDRSQRTGRPHPMAPRNGDEVEERLRQVPLYDPALDLAVETAGGEPAAYALFWSDPVTGVGLVEPVRVEDAHQRRGLATALVSAGLERLAAAGAARLKVGFGTAAAGAVYQGLGFRVGATDSTYGTVLPG